MPALTDDLDTLGQVISRGGGMNEFYGPAHLHKYVWIGKYTADPSTTGWVADDAGRLWFNTTTHTFKYWDGSTVQELGGGGGASAFIGLTDAPAAYTDMALRHLRVNAAEDAVEFGPRFFISDDPPTSGDGENGDFWAEY